MRLVDPGIIAPASIVMPSQAGVPDDSADSVAWLPAGVAGVSCTNPGCMMHIIAASLSHISAVWFGHNGDRRSSSAVPTDAPNHRPARRGRGGRG